MVLVPYKTFMNLPEAKRNRILTATMRTINDKGYDKTTVSDIVKAAGIPRGSFYQYFNDKLDAFMYLLEWVQTQKMAYMQPVLKRLETEPFIELYEDLVDAGVQFARVNNEAYQLGYQLYRSSDSTVQQLTRRFETYGVELYASFIRTDQKNGYLKADVDSELVGKMLYNFNVKELFNLVYGGGSDAEIRHTAQAVMHIIKYGIKKG